MYSQRLHMVVVACYIRVHAYITCRISIGAQGIKTEIASICRGGSYTSSEVCKIYLRHEQEDLAKEQGMTLQCIWQMTYHVHHETPQQVTPANATVLNFVKTRLLNISLINSKYANVDQNDRLKI
jgi:hypothetical protein